MVNEKQTERQGEPHLTLTVRPKDFIVQVRNHFQPRQLIYTLFLTLVTTLIMVSLLTFLADLFFIYEPYDKHFTLMRTLTSLVSILIILVGMSSIIFWTSKHRARNREIALTRLRQKEGQFLAQIQIDLDRLINRRTT